MPLILAQIDWNSLLHEDDFVGPVMASLVLVTTGIIILAAIISIQWRKARQARDEAGLKAQMIQRGFSAGEIERVLKAGVSYRRRGRRADLVDCRELVAGC